MTIKPPLRRIHSIQTWRPWLAFMLARLGWPGLVGSLLLVAASLFWQTQTQALNNTLIALETEPVEAYPTARPDPEPWQVEWPKADQFPVLLGHVFAAAHDAGLQIERGDYRLVRERDSHLWRQRFTLPLSGGYPQVRVFLKDVMNAYPNLSLDSIQMQRDEIGNADLAVTMTFSFYFRGD